MAGKSSKKRGKRNTSSQSKRKKSNKEHIVVSDDADGVFFEVETIVDARETKDGVWEYRVRWKGFGPSDDTWEKSENLCSSLYDLAKSLREERKPKNRKEGKIESEIVTDTSIDERLFEGVASTTDKDTESEAESESESDASPDNDKIPDHWAWNDEEQIQFREIERIDVNDADAGRRVTDARLNGVPVVLVGHKGWPQFARGWLKPTGKVAKEAHDNDTSNKSPSMPTDLNNGAKPQSDSPNSQKENLPNVDPTRDNEVGNTATESAKSQASHKKDNGVPNSVTKTSGLEEGISLISEESSPEWLDLSGGEWDVDVDAMIEDIGHEKVPIVRRNYKEENPISETKQLANFLKKCWPNTSSPSAEDKKNAQLLYLHQWQFPLSDARHKLCGKGRINPLPNDIIGEDLLSCWLDSSQCNGDNPFQYIFMGRDGTMSRLHRDPGGLAISIAPIVGQKEVVLVHRSDGTSCLYHLKAKLPKINLQKFPMASHARIYKTIVSPGEILLMPQGTFHQCRNVTPCLSYHRFHLDTVNLRGFLESMINEDAPEINHGEVIWNAASEIFKQLDAYVDMLRESKQAHPSQLMDLTVPPEIVQKVNTMRALRNICREICRRYEEAEGFKNSDANGHQKQSPAANWGGLVTDIDSTLHDFKYRHYDRKPPFRPRTGEPRRAKSTGQERTEGKVPSQKSRDDDLKVALGFLPRALESKEVFGDELREGDNVEVRFHGRRVKGIIDKIDTSMYAALVAYEGFTDVYDEFVPVGSLREPVAGEACTELLPQHAKPGKLVVYKHGLEDYRAKVKSLKKGTFLRLKLKVGNIHLEPWLPQSSIMARIETA